MSAHIHCICYEEYICFLDDIAKWYLVDLDIFWHIVIQHSDSNNYSAIVDVKRQNAWFSASMRNSGCKLRIGDAKDKKVQISCVWIANDVFQKLKYN